MRRATILLSFAHPDDESFFISGTIRRYAEAGARMVLISATSGEAGTTGEPPLCAREELGGVREAELREAAGILGVEELHLLGYPDRGLASAPPGEIRGKLVGLLRRYRPEVVITFDPNGVNGHPDHVAAGRFTMDAVQAAADARWHPEHGAAHMVARLLWTAPVRPYNMGITDNLAAQAGIDFLIYVAPWATQKSAALRAHRTQRGSVDRHFFANPDWERRLSIEALRLGWGKPARRVPAADILEDLIFMDTLDA